MNNLCLRRRKQLTSIRQFYQIISRRLEPLLSSGVVYQRQTINVNSPSQNTLEKHTNLLFFNSNQRLFQTRVASFSNNNEKGDNSGQKNDRNEKAKNTSSSYRTNLKNISEFETIYAFRYIVPCRMLSRLKYYQLFGTIGLGIPLVLGTFTGKISIEILTAFCATNSVLLIGLFNISRYIQRIVGLIAVNKESGDLKIAHLTNKGKRKDMIMTMDNLLPVQFDGKKYIIQFKDQPDKLYLFPNIYTIYNSFVMSKIFGIMADK